jgi:hypothetical protein
LPSHIHTVHLLPEQMPFPAEVPSETDVSALMNILHFQTVIHFQFPHDNLLRGNHFK